MNRCVRIVDQDGVNILDSEIKIFRITAADTLRGLFSRVAPESTRKRRLVSVKLQQAVTTPSNAATHTEEFDEKILDLVKLVVGSQGVDPIVVTYVVALDPERAQETTASGPPSTADRDIYASIRNHQPPVHVAGAHADEELQHCLTPGEVAGWYGDEQRHAQAESTRLYLTLFCSGFQPEDPRRAVFEAVHAVLQHVTTAFLQTLHFDCGVAMTELLQFAETRDVVAPRYLPPESHETGHRPAKLSVAHGIAHLFSSKAIFRSAS